MLMNLKNNRIFSILKMKVPATALFCVLLVIVTCIVFIKYYQSAFFADLQINLDIYKSLR